MMAKPSPSISASHSPVMTCFHYGYDRHRVPNSATLTGSVVITVWSSGLVASNLGAAAVACVHPGLANLDVMQRPLQT
jgi:hypothetical protein